MRIAKKRPPESPPRVLMVTGFTNPWGSPISHHADRLGDALRELGVEVDTFSRPEWGYGTFREALAAAHAQEGTILHLHYPMTAMRRSVVPALLATRTRSVVTIHEASTIGQNFGRAKVTPAVAFASKVVFTNEFERDFITKLAVWVKRKSQVIPLASNIPASLEGEPEAGRIVGFGTIRPSSGWESFVDAARLARDAHPGWSFAALGFISDEQLPYRDSLFARADGARLEFSGELSAEEASRELRRGIVAYLPYHDGASGRRSSLLAAMANGVPVVTTAGAQTTKELRRAVSITSNPEEALSIIARLMVDPAERSRVIEAGLAYYAARTWPVVAQRHLDLYNSLR